MSKTALVFGGGGAKGAYQIGVVKALEELNINYDIITGCSVGSINGAITAQGDWELAKKLWKTLSTEKILDLKDETKELNLTDVIEQNGYDYKNLKNLLKQYIDEEKLRKSPVDFGLVTVKYPEMTPLYIFKEDMERGAVVDYILGSSAFFPAMKPHKIGDNLYIDGGFSDNLPINMAIEKGAKRIIAVDLKAIGIIKKPKEKDVKITRISSCYDLGKILEFNSKRAKINMKLGYFDTLKAFSKLDGFKYTFIKNDISTYVKSNLSLYESLLSRIFKDSEKPLKAAFIKSLITLFQNEIKDIKKPSKTDLAAFVIENTMSMLDIPYFEKYKLKKAHFLIKKKIKSCDISDIYKLNDILLNLNMSGNLIDIIKKLKDITENADKIQFVKFLSENIEFILNKNPKIIFALGICAPKELFSALHLMFI